MRRCLQSFKKHSPIGDIVDALWSDGAVIVQNLVAPDTMSRLTAQLEPVLASEDPGGGEFFGYRKKSVGRLFARGREFSEHLLMNERVLEIADATLLPEFPMAVTAPKQKRAQTVDNAEWATYKKEREISPSSHIGPNCHHYRVNVSGALQVWPGGVNQPLHREMGNYRPYLQHDPHRPEWILAINWAGTDFTATNGATRLALGSHRWNDGREAQEHEVEKAIMAKGSAVFWLGKTLHGLGANTDTKPRTGILFTMVVNWLATEENQFLAVPPDLARGLPEKAQQLLGYRSSPTLGWVGGLDQENMLIDGKSGPL